MATITKLPDGDLSLGNLRGELITLQPAVADYATGGYLIQGISGTTETTGDVGLSKVLLVEPAGGQGGISPVWNPATSKMQMLANSPSAGIPLGLGTLSAAATNSTYTAAGLVTILTATPPPLGSFVSLSNGATAKGIFLNGVIGLVNGVVAGTSYTINFGQGVALAYASAADTLKYQVVQAGAGNPLQAQALAAPITGVLATANLLTITQANSLQVGQFVYLNGPFKAASVYALGAIVQVASATATGWQTSAETAVASLLVTNGGVPIQSYPYISGPTAAISNVLAVASGAAASGLLTLTATQSYQAGQIAVVEGVATTTLLNGTIGTIIASGLTSALVKMNGWTAVVNAAADTGSVALLVTGPPASAQSEVPAGTDLSAYAFQLLAIGY
jgi:hypothetical protein